MTKNTTCAIVTLLALSLPLLAAAAHAEHTVIKEYKFDLKGIHEVDLRGGVGSINVIHTNTDKVSVVLEIKQTNLHWWKRDIDLGSVELHDHVRGDRLQLTQTDEDLSIDWTVEVPTVDRMSIDVGVGSIDAELDDTGLTANVGVGEAKLRMPEKYAGEIRLDTGVGDARLQGGESKRERRSFVSQKINGQGKGTREVRVKVGVGDIRVQLAAPKP